MSAIDRSRYIMDRNNQVVLEQQVRPGNVGRSFTLLTYSDGSKWVQLGDKQKERFCGFLYLQNALKVLVPDGHV